MSLSLTPMPSSSSTSIQEHNSAASKSIHKAKKRKAQAVESTAQSYLETNKKRLKLRQSQQRIEQKRDAQQQERMTLLQKQEKKWTNQQWLKKRTRHELVSLCSLKTEVLKKLVVTGRYSVLEELPKQELLELLSKTLSNKELGILRREYNSRLSKNAFGSHKVQLAQKHQTLHYVNARLFEIFGAYLKHLQHQHQQQQPEPNISISYQHYGSTGATLSIHNKGRTLTNVQLLSVAENSIVVSADFRSRNPYKYWFGPTCKEQLKLEFHPQRLINVCSVKNTEACSYFLTNPLEEAKVDIDYTDALSWYMTYNRYLLQPMDNENHRVAVRWTATSAGIARQSRQYSEACRKADQIVINTQFERPKVSKIYNAARSPIIFAELPCTLPCGCSMDATPPTGSTAVMELNLDLKARRLYGSTDYMHNYCAQWGHGSSSSKSYELEIALEPFVSHDLYHKQWEQFVDEHLPQLRFSSAFAAVSQYVGGLPLSAVAVDSVNDK
jgi:hypothetical protein